MINYYFLVDNSRSDYRIVIKNIRDKNQVTFQGFTFYDQEVTSGYYDEDTIVMDGSFLPNVPK